MREFTHMPADSHNPFHTLLCVVSLRIARKLLQAYCISYTVSAGPLDPHSGGRGHIVWNLPSADPPRRGDQRRNILLQNVSRGTPPNI